ncbi:MAG: guanylate kinase [Firmicutes bacterium HGW-Firmicutes-16]|nr:MAG: guanylate kinase [Firmicutes bacterium HGW-Firmicutes-16]
MSDCGKLIVVSGPSGAGKSTVISRVMEQDKSVVFSVSATTRKPREGERDGVDYFFIDSDSFKKMINNDELLEHAQYVENFYGTPKAPVQENLNKGLSVLFDIEVQGAMQIKNICPEAILIFVIPSEFSQIEKRLHIRGTDSEEKIKQRIKTAKYEYSMALSYDYIVLNDDPDSAANEIKSIITAEKCKAVNRQNYLTEVNSL